MPFDVDLDSLDAPPEMTAAGFEDAVEETAVLKEVLRAAREAAAAEAKMRAVLRLLRRIGEPLIVFTEYRDTLDAVDRDGCVPVPQGHGLGVEIDWDWVEKHRTGFVEYK